MLPWSLLIMGLALMLISHYRKSSNTSRPLIQVASIRGRTIGRPVQPLIVGKILNPSKLLYLDHFELFEVKNLALELIFICLLYTSPSPRDISGSRMPSSA